MNSKVIFVNRFWLNVIPANVRSTLFVSTTSRVSLLSSYGLSQREIRRYTSHHVHVPSPNVPYSRGFVNVTVSDCREVAGRRDERKSCFFPIVCSYVARGQEVETRKTICVRIVRYCCYRWASPRSLCAAEQVIIFARPARTYRCNVVVISLADGLQNKERGRAEQTRGRCSSGPPPVMDFRKTKRNENRMPTSRGRPAGPC